MANKKYEVLVDRISLVVGKGSIVTVDERQYEVARPFLKEVGTRETNIENKAEDIKPNANIEKKTLAQAAKENKISNNSKNRK